jgi:FtsH-binding integral membrane protein
MNQYTNAFEQTRSMTMTRNILRNVYVWMTLGLAITGVVAFGVANNESLLRAIFSNQVFFFGIIIAQLAMVFVLSGMIMKLSAMVATLLFAGYSALNGLSLSIIFLAYTGTSIAQVFFITAGTFAAMSLYAVTTKKDLSGWGNYLFMGLIGIVIASLVNLFLRSDGMSFIISIIGVLLFTGLTAYDTQKIKRMSDYYGDGVGEENYIRLSILGALKLYLDFINLFLFMLRLLGNRK